MIVLSLGSAWRLRRRIPVRWFLLAVVFLLLSVKALEFLEYLGRKTGRLAMKWQ